MNPSLDTQEIRSKISSSFPGLSASHFHVTSPITRTYNCIAWAASDDTRWWWPDDNLQCYWPCYAPRNMTLQAFFMAFQTIGYNQISENMVDSYHDVIAFMTRNGNTVTHAMRRLDNGLWTSKLGKAWDIEHELHAIEGNVYGKVMAFMGRNPKHQNTTIT